MLTIIYKPKWTFSIKILWFLQDDFSIFFAQFRAEFADKRFKFAYVSSKTFQVSFDDQIELDVTGFGQSSTDRENVNFV